jgi:hypothetical protein
MATVKMTIQDGQKPTAEQIKRINDAAKRPITYDENFPKLTKKQLAEFKRVSEEKKAERESIVFSVRVPKKTLTFWKSLGKGYTGVISRLLDEAQNYPDLIKKCL